MWLDLNTAEAESDETLLWQRFTVAYDYPVAFTRGLFAKDNPLLADMLARREPTKRHRVFAVIDEGLAAARPDLASQIVSYAATYNAQMELLAEPMLVPGGEAVKTDPAAVLEVVEATHRYGIDRHSYILGVGGGAMLDAIGLAAATAHRGVRHVRAPSTVLAQNDSGVGVKNAINLNGLKNYVGSFAPPWAVLNDYDLLDSLPDRERVAGISEAVKVALIRDRAFFERLERDVKGLAVFRAPETEYMIRRCAELHMHQIAHGGDPFEMGSARPLDFGHWAAHKLESLTKSEVRHGEAVAIGIALDSRYSVLAGLLPEGDDVRIARLLEQLGFKLWHPALKRRGADGAPAVLTGLREFQEHLGGRLTITLLSDIGVGEEVHEIDHALMMQAADWLEARDRASTTDLAPVGGS